MSIVKNIVFSVLITLTMMPSYSVAIMDIQVDDQTSNKAMYHGLSIKDAAMLTLAGTGVILAGFFGYSQLKNKKENTKNTSEQIESIISEGIANLPTILKKANTVITKPETKKIIEESATDLHQIVETAKANNLGTPLQQIAKDLAIPLAEVAKSLPPQSPLNASDIPALGKAAADVGIHALKPEAIEALQGLGSEYLTPEARATLKALKKAQNMGNKKQEEKPLPDVLLSAYKDPSVQKLLNTIKTSQSEQKKEQGNSSSDFGAILQGLNTAAQQARQQGMSVEDVLNHFGNQVGLSGNKSN